jgi:monoamine oxidase
MKEKNPIIGGDLAGLTAAIHLSKIDHKLHGY